MAKILKIIAKLRDIKFAGSPDPPYLQQHTRRAAVRSSGRDCAPDFHDATPQDRQLLPNEHGYKGAFNPYPRSIK